MSAGFNEAWMNVVPAIAPDLNLNLVRYDIPAGTELPVHLHEGAQIG
jgi:hypothetical protein